MENSTLCNLVPPEPIITKLGTIDHFGTPNHKPSSVKFRWVGKSPVTFYTFSFLVNSPSGNIRRLT